MNCLRYVRLIGTMHVSPRSRDKVREAILKEKPSAIAIELDRDRFYAMQNPRRVELGDALKSGRRGLLQYILFKVEERLGEEFGMVPGGEMREAITLAQVFNIPLALIDEDINLITMKLLRAPFREKLFLLLESLAVFLPSAPSADIMEDYKLMMVAFKRRYPYLFHVLVEERNEIMARNLRGIVMDLKARGVKKPKVVAVVGLGHKRGIEKILNSCEC